MSLREVNDAYVEERAAAHSDGHLKEPIGGGTLPPMDGRVSALEIHMEYVQRDLKSIADKLDTVISQTSDLPTKRDLSTFRWQWVATAAAAIAIIVGSIIGGLSWIKPDAAPPSPVIVQMPAPVPIAPLDPRRR